MEDFALWRRALTPTEIADKFKAGQAGQNLGGLLIQPNNLLTITSLKRTPSSAKVEIQFQNLGPWTTFQLRRATNPAGPYSPIFGLAPIALGSGHYRYAFLSTNPALEFFRIEGSDVITVIGNFADSPPGEFLPNLFNP